MTDAEIFHREMICYGGRFEAPTESLAKKTYDQIASQADDLISRARKHLPRLPHIHFNFVLSGEINAWAFKSDGRYFIGLTTGTVFMLSLVTMRMLSDSRLFPAIGNPRQEADNLPSLTNFAPNANQMYMAGHTPNRPKTDSRFHYASHLIEQALLFLVGHEIAHITLGHVDYLQSKTGTAIIAEMGWNQADSETLIERQSIEMEADIRSVNSRMASQKATHENSHSEKRPWANSPARLAESVFDWAFGMNLIFRLFGDVRFNSSQLATEAYPPFLLRRAMATFQARGDVLKQWDSALKDETVEALLRAVRDTEFAVAQILGEEPTLEGMKDAFGPLGRKHYKRLIDYLHGDLKKRLAPFAYE